MLRLQTRIFSTTTRTATTIMARDTFIDYPAEEDNVKNEEEKEELDVVLVSKGDSTAPGAVHRDADVAAAQQWWTDTNKDGKSWDDINTIEKDGRTALHTALLKNASWEVVNGLLDKLDEKVINAIDDDGYTVLHYACRWKLSSDIINGILDKLDGMASNAINNDGYTA
eukprot:scaffold250_cov181-Chaetoceros_neogracile.AAC.2